MDRYKIILTEKETEDWYNFCKDHKDCCKKYLNREFFSTTGGQHTLIITPTGLGDCVVAKCNSCGKEKDITDIDNW